MCAPCSELPSNISTMVESKSGSETLVWRVDGGSVRGEGLEGRWRICGGRGFVKPRQESKSQNYDNIDGQHRPDINHAAVRDTRKGKIFTDNSPELEGREEMG